MIVMANRVTTGQMLIFLASALALAGCHLVAGYDPSTDGTSPALDTRLDAQLPVDGPPPPPEGPTPPTDGSIPPPKDAPVPLPDAPKPPMDKAVPLPDKPPSVPVWTKLKTNPLTWGNTIAPSIWGISATEIYLAVSTAVYRCKDVGATLTCTLVANNPTSGQYYTALGGAGGQVMAVGHKGLVWLKSGGFKTVPNGAKLYFSNVWCTGAKACYLVGYDSSGFQPEGVLVFWDGTNFTSINTKVSGLAQHQSYHSVWTGSGGLMVLGADACTLRYRASSGAPWQDKTFTMCTGHVSGLWGSGKIVHAVTSNGRHLRYLSNWTLVSSAKNVLAGIWGGGSACVFAPANVGMVRFYNGSSWGKKEFTSTDTGTKEHLRDAWGVGCNHVYVMGFNSTLLRYK